jgi:hypothetical protein
MVLGGPVRGIDTDARPVTLKKAPGFKPGALARGEGLLPTGWPGGWLRH